MTAFTTSLCDLLRFSGSTSAILAVAPFTPPLPLNPGIETNTNDFSGIESDK